MKRKIFGVFCALVLALSLGLVTAVPATVSANGTTFAGSTISVESVHLCDPGGETEDAFNGELETLVLDDVAFDAQTCSQVIIEGEVSALVLGAGWVDTAYVEIGLRPEATMNTRNAGVYLIALNGASGTEIHLQDYTGGGRSGGVITINKDADFRYKITLRPSASIGGTATLEVWVGDESLGTATLAYGYASTWEENKPGAYDENLSSAHLFYSIIADRRGIADQTYRATVGNITIDDTLYVGTGQQFTTIQAAIDFANPGDTISVAAGTYPEYILIDKPLTVRSTEGAEETIIDGIGFRYMVRIYSANVTFEGFTVTNPTYEGGADATGILIGAYLGEPVDNVHILNNIVEAVRSGTSGTPSMFGATGINCGRGPLSNVVISGNTIQNIHNPDGASVDHTCGINMWDGADGVVISNNTISDVKYNGILLECASNVRIEENPIITGCQTGVRLEPYEGAIISDVTVNSNNFTDNSIQVFAEVLVIEDVLAGNNFDRAVVIDREGGSFLHTIWSKIQDAIDNAIDNDTIKVAAGTYDPFTVATKTGLTIQSDGMVTVQGVQSVATTYNDRDCVVFVKDSSNIVLDGLDIQGDGLGTINTKNYGVIYENSSGEINDCTVSPNTIGDMYSTAIGIWDGSEVIVDPCIIENFGRVGVLVYNGCTVSILNSTIEGQVYSGEGEVCYGIEVEGVSESDDPDTASHVTIKGNEIYNCDNTFGTGPTWDSSGVYINGWLEYYPEADSTVIVENNDIHNNYIGIIVIKSSLSYAHFNNIYDNRDCGVDSLPDYNETTAVFDATRNWWGHASGPSHELSNGKWCGKGDKVSDNVDYKPWLHKSKEDVVAKKKPSYAQDVVLDKYGDYGWNTFSTPVFLDDEGDTWNELYDLTDLDYSVAYRFDSDNQTFVNLMTADEYAIKPGEGFFIKMDDVSSLPILYSTEENLVPPTRTLTAGWNLIALASLEDMKAGDALGSIATVADLAGYSQVVSPVGNVRSGAVLANGTLYVGEAYWVYMLGERTLAGFTITPVEWVP